MSQSVQVVERPILFSGEMVRAILDGRKTQTRRVVAHRITGPNPPKESIFDCYKGKKWVAAFGLDGNGNFLGIIYLTPLTNVRESSTFNA